METLSKASGVRMLLGAFDRSKTTEPVLNLSPQKPVTPKAEVSSPLPRSTPEKEGLSSAHLAGFAEELSRSDSAIHSLMVLKNGKVVAECYKKGYGPGIWHSTFSLCKSITGMAIGLLVDDGLLDINRPLREFFPEQKRSLSKKLRPSMTVRNLLAMTSGAEFAEGGAVMYTDWVSAFFESSLKFDPGKKFNYNSMNSYMLAAVVRRITGRPMSRLLEERIFRPLGITEYHWETCPKGTEKGGFGMYLKTEDMAKLGLLLMNGGMWGTQRILSERWVREMTSAKAIPESESSRFNYGYQIWVGKKQNSFLMNGLFGQNVIGYRDSGIIVVATGGSCLAFHDGSYFDLLDKYFGSPCPESGGLLGGAKLYLATRHLSRVDNPIWERKAGALTAKRLLKPYEGITLIPAKPEPSLGMLPKLSSLVQNNYAKGIGSMSFRFDAGRVILTVDEGGIKHELPYGLHSPQSGSYSFGGETYLTSGSGKICLDEDGDAVLSLRLDFIETVSSRLIKIAFKRDGISVSLAETPGVRVLEILASQFVGDPRAKRMINAISSKVDTGYIRHRIKEAMEPVFAVLPKQGK